jgi:hypothetical protein
MCAIASPWVPTHKVIKTTASQSCGTKTATLTNAVAAIIPKPMMLLRVCAALRPAFASLSASHPPASVATNPTQNGSADTIPDLSNVILRSRTKYPGNQLTKTPSAYKYPIWPKAMAHVERYRKNFNHLRSPPCAPGADSRAPTLRSG